MIMARDGGDADGDYKLAKKWIKWVGWGVYGAISGGSFSRRFFTPAAKHSGLYSEE